MLVIRLSRTGRKNQPAYRMVVAEKSKPVKGRFVEVVGFYNPSEKKAIKFDEKRIAYWISKGAKPSDTVASILKFNGVSGMDEFIGRRDIKRRKKNAPEEEEAPAPAPAAAPAAEEAAPAEEPAQEEPKEEAPAAEEPAKEEAAE